jgi:hypothetical protein
MGTTIVQVYGLVALHLPTIFNTTFVLILFLCNGILFVFRQLILTFFDILLSWGELRDA